MLVQRDEVIVRGARYTVKQVADITGVPAATLRAWERRYNVVSPQRSDSRYRLYDEDEVTRLSRMAGLVRRGSPASLAAEQVLNSLPDPGPTLPPDSGEGGAGDAPARPAPPISELVRVGQSFDEAMLTQVLDEAFARGSFETVVQDWVLPALGEVGSAWEQGDLDVAAEHFVSAAVHRRLAAAFEAAGVHTGAPVAVVGLPPGALHQLGALAFATCLKRQGIDVRFLGADVPVDSWDHAVQRLTPSAAVVTVPMVGDARSAAPLLTTLRHRHPDLRVWVGGGGARATLARASSSLTAAVGDHGAAPDLDRTAATSVVALPPSVPDSALLVARALHRR